MPIACRYSFLGNFIKANKMEEIWKDIEGFEGIYQVSNLGRVRSLDRYVNACFRHYSVRRTKGRILKLRNDIHGYPRVGLGKYNKILHVHRLVAKAFIPNPENKPCIDHINTIRSDNRVENLRWVTQGENNRNILTIEKQRNIRLGTKLKEETKIKQREKAMKFKIKCVETGICYESIKECSRQTKINAAHIGQVCRNIRKSAGGFHWCFC